MTNACAGTVLGQGIGRVRHAFHATRHDQVGSACLQRFLRHDGGLHARTAHLVHGGRLRVEAKARAQRRLPRGRLSQPCWQDAAHVDAVDHVHGRTRALHCRFHRSRAQIGRL